MAKKILIVGAGDPSPAIIAGRNLGRSLGKEIQIITADEALEMGITAENPRDTKGPPLTFSPPKPFTPPPTRRERRKNKRKRK
nr:hypothetical protein [uncultured Draconibacterium sp.]